MEFTHFDEKGRGRMVDVSQKEDTVREAIATGKISISQEVMDKIVQGTIKKGDVISVAQIAGIMGTKETSSIIPMCHPIAITGVDMDFELNTKENYIKAICKVKTLGKTGVEMEALTGVATALLTIYDMCKAVDKGMVIEDIRLEEKIGGKSGHYTRG
jgi:cyclic pyranopterin phosphate synthase